MRERTSKRVAALAIEHWDPTEAQRRHEQAVHGGKKSRRGKKDTELPSGSIKDQMEALNASRSTVMRLRRQPPTLPNHDEAHLALTFR